MVKHRIRVRSRFRVRSLIQRTFDLVGPAQLHRDSGCFRERLFAQLKQRRRPFVINLEWNIRKPLILCFWHKWLTYRQIATARMYMSQNITNHTHHWKQFTSNVLISFTFFLNKCYTINDKSNKHIETSLMPITSSNWKWIPACHQSTYSPISFLT